MRKKVSQFLRFIASLRFAIILLSLIALYIVIGTLLPQYTNTQWYLERYPKSGPLIIALQLNKAYSSPLFIILIALFAINLTSCTLISLKGQRAQLRSTFYPSSTSSENSLELKEREPLENYLKKHRYKIERDEEKGSVKAAKFRWGVLGATITHIGLLFLFIGGTLGNSLASEMPVSLLPGNEHYFEKEDFTLRLDDFYMSFEEGGAVKQYISEVTVIDSDGSESSAQLYVNKPFHHKGLGFYQANFGWTGHLRLFDTEKEEVVAQGLLRTGRSYFDADSHLTIHLMDYYPEMAINHQRYPISLSNREINPYYAVVLFAFNESVDSYMLAPNEKIVYENMEISFTHAVAFTGLLVRNDPSFPIMIIGFIIILVGMVVSFYCYPRFIFYSDGILKTVSRRNGWIFYNSVRSALSLEESDGTKGV